MEASALDAAPVYTDVKTFDGKPFRGLVDILSGGFPCQPFSLAGVPKYESLGYHHGFKNETKGTLFFDIQRILVAKKPKAFILENVENLEKCEKSTFLFNGRFSGSSYSDLIFGLLNHLMILIY